MRPAAHTVHRLWHQCTAGTLAGAAVGSARRTGAQPAVERMTAATGFLYTLGVYDALAAALTPPPRLRHHPLATATETFATAALAAATETPGPSATVTAASATTSTVISGVITPARIDLGGS